MVSEYLSTQEMECVCVSTRGLFPLTSTWMGGCSCVCLFLLKKTKKIGYNTEYSMI